MIICRTSNDGHHYRPALFRQIEYFEGKLYYEDRGLGHPMPLASRSWSALERALDRATRDFVTLLANDNAGGNSEYSAALDSYAALIGRAAEYIETITENVASAFVPVGEKISIAKAKKERRHIDIICNKLKHHQNYLVPVKGAATDGRSAWGFSVYRVDATGEQHPNLEVHRDAKAFSLARELRRAVVDCYVISERVSDFISEKGSIAAGSANQPQGDDVRRLALLQRLSELPTICFPFERGNSPSVEVTGSNLTIRASGDDTSRLTGQIKMTVSQIPYEGALKIKVPM